MLNNEPFDRVLRRSIDGDRRLCKSSPLRLELSSSPFVFFGLLLLLLLMAFDVGCKLIGMGRAGDGRK